MKIIRRVNNEYEVQKALEAAKVLQLVPTNFQAFGYWVDMEGDPWNTPCECVVEGSSVFHRDGERMYRTNNKSEVFFEITWDIPDNQYI